MSMSSLHSMPSNSLRSTSSNSRSKSLSKIYVKNGRKCYKYVPSNSIGVEDNDIPHRFSQRYHRKKMNIQCKCGQPLIRKMITKQSVSCNECKQQIAVNEIVFACPSCPKSTKCQKCAVQKLIKNFQETRIPNYYQEEDKLPSSGGECGVNCLIQ